MMTHLRKLTIFVALLGMAVIFVGCSNDSDDPTGPNQNDFPSIHGILISPNAAVYVDDTVTLTPQTEDPNNDHIRYVWSKDAGTFDPIEAVGPNIKWTAPSTRGTYSVIAVGDDGNGGTSQKQIDIKVYGGNQTGTIDVVGGVRSNPIGGTIRASVVP